jgi:hypothetical protein
MAASIMQTTPSDRIAARDQCADGVRDDGVTCRGRPCGQWEAGGGAVLIFRISIIPMGIIHLT